MIRLAAAFCLFGQAVAAADLCAPDRVRVLPEGANLMATAAANVATFRVEVAQSPAERAEGLMFRTALAADAGMIFVYDPPETVAFWMKNTLIPLDMVFIGADGRVLNVAGNRQPHDLTGAPSAGPVRLVLEIAGGEAARRGIGPGSLVQSAFLDAATALWPCNAGE